MATTTMQDTDLPLSERAFVALKERVLSGTIAPGSVLSESRVAEELGMSRTPVREALLRLTEEGFAQRFPGRGVIVLDLGVRDILEVFEVQACLEQYAIARMFENGRTINLEALNALVHGQREALELQDRRRFLTLDRKFHQTIVEHLENHKLAQIMRNASDLILYGGYRALRGDQQMREALVEHEVMVAALARGDRDAALAASRTHIEGAKRRLLD